MFSHISQNRRARRVAGELHVDRMESGDHEDATGRVDEVGKVSLPDFLYGGAGTVRV